MGGNLEAWWLSHDPFAKLQGVLPLASGLFIKFCFCWYLSCITHLAQPFGCSCCWHEIPWTSTHLYTLHTHFSSYPSYFPSGWLSIMGECIWLQMVSTWMDTPIWIIWFWKGTWYNNCIPLPMWHTKGIRSVLRTNWCIENDTLLQTILVLFLFIFHVQSPPLPNANSKYN
jgi:hypothetical protein